MTGAAAGNSPASPRPGGTEALFARPVRLLLHGAEGTTLGGPSVRVPRTAEVMRDHGIPAEVGSFGMASEIPEDIVHLFNVWPPASALHALRALKAAGKTVVFSPIYLDLQERGFWQSALPDLADAAAVELAAAYAGFRAHVGGRGRLDEIQPGYHAMLREMIALADHVILLSQHERTALAALGADVAEHRSSLVANPVNADRWAGGDPVLFRDAYLRDLPGPAEYVICLGRIEERKNQLLLARAMRDLPLRLVLVGHAGNPAYAEKLRDVAGPDLLLTERIEPGSPMLRAALTGARAFALPSWSEGAALAALEAAACGTPLVLGDRGSEREYFGDLARYCDPGDPAAIRAALDQALGDGARPEHGAALQAWVRDRYGWDRHVRATARAYARALEAPGGAVQQAPAPAEHRARHLAIDITPPRQPGLQDHALARLAEGLRRAAGAGETPVRLIFWNADLGAYVTLPDRFRDMDQALRYCRAADAAMADAPVDLPPGGAIVTLSTPWRDDPAGLLALETLKTRTGSSLIALLPDADPLQAPYRHDPTEATHFRQSVLRLAALAETIVTPTGDIARALRRGLASAHQAAPDIRPLPGAATAGLGLTAPPAEDLPFAAPRFALCPDDMNAGANQVLLCNAWARLAEAGELPGDLHLVIAGGRGNATEALADRVARDPRLSHRVHLLTDPAPGLLARLFSDCAFTLCPGFGVGWALPVQESLRRGKPCLSGSAPGDDPETGGGLVEGLDPGDMPAWAARIRDLANDPGATGAGADHGAADFTDLARGLADIARQPRALRGLRPAFAGEPLSAARGAPPLAIGFDRGWRAAEAEGRRTDAALARIRLRARRDGGRAGGAGTLRVLLKLTPEIPEGRRVPLHILCGDTCLFACRIGAGDTPLDLVLSLPAGKIGADGEVALDLQLPDGPDPARLLLRSVILLEPELSNPLMYLSDPPRWSLGEFVLTADLSDPGHRAVLAPGLAFSPAWGVGARGGSLDLRVPVLPGAGAHVLHLTVRPIATPAAPVHARFAWNGRDLGTRDWSGDMPEDVSLALSAEDIDRSGPGVLTIDCGSVLTPADLGLGPTADLAGLGVTDLLLVPEDMR